MALLQGVVELCKSHPSAPIPVHLDEDLTHRVFMNINANTLEDIFELSLSEEIIPIVIPAAEEIIGRGMPVLLLTSQLIQNPDLLGFQLQIFHYLRIQLSGYLGQGRKLMTFQCNSGCSLGSRRSGCFSRLMRRQT